MFPFFLFKTYAPLFLFAIIVYLCPEELKAAKLIIVDDSAAPVGRTQRLFAALMQCVLMNCLCFRGLADTGWLSSVV